jgi:hypothetical protein
LNQLFDDRDSLDLVAKDESGCWWFLSGVKRQRRTESVCEAIVNGVENLRAKAPFEDSREIQDDVYDLRHQLKLNEMLKALQKYNSLFKGNGSLLGPIRLSEKCRLGLPFMLCFIG